MSTHSEIIHRTVELRDTAEHAHLAAEQARGKQDHLTGAEQSRRGMEHSGGVHPDGHAATTGHGIVAFSHDDIAELAHKMWEERGGPSDSPDEDWFRAVKELRSRAIGERIATR